MHIKWIISTILTVIAITVPVIIFLITDKTPPRFIIDVPFVSPDEPVTIKADNKEANLNKPLNIEFDGLLFHQKGIPVQGNNKQFWHFKIREQKDVLEDMLKFERHKIRVGFSGENLSDFLTVVFTEGKVTLLEKEGTVNNNVPKSRKVVGTKVSKQTISHGLLKGRRLSEGKVKGLTILVEFQDVLADVEASDIDAMLNGTNYNENGNYCSIREYFLIVSNGKLDYSNLVVGPVKLSKNRSHYKQNQFFKEALDIVIKDFSIDLADFDSRKEGIVDVVNFMYAGPTVYEDWLWPHIYSLDYTYKGMTTNNYTVKSMGRSSKDLSIGDFCKHTGTVLCRFPDLFDYGRRDGDAVQSEGMGRYCLMSSGGHLDNGRTPSPVSAYLRGLVGWYDEEILLNVPGEYEAVHGDYSTILKYKTNKPNEYFIIENRSRLGLDKHLPSSGLAIYHCDQLGSNEWQDGTSDLHYQCALIQADGNLDLENNRNKGDKGDMFSKSDSLILSYNTTPSSATWDGTDSGLELMGISKPGKMIKFETGNPNAVIPVVVKENRPNLLIPNNNPAGIRDTIKIIRSGKIMKVMVSIDITYTYSSELEVGLETPFNSRITLHKGKGDSKYYLVKTFKPAANSALASCKGESMEGDWTITVKDKGAQDSGRLNSWKIEIGYEEIAKSSGELETSKKQENSLFNVVLKKIGPNKLQVIKAVRAETALGLKEAKALVDAVPKSVKEGVSKDEADKVKKALEDTGAVVEIAKSSGEL